MPSASGPTLAIVVPAILAISIFFIYTYSKRSNSATIERLKNKIAKLDPKFKNLDIIEGNRSETEDKTYITLCVRDPVTKKIYQDNTLIYVMLHEVAHTLNKPQYSEHGPEWQAIFANLLERAEQAGIYSSSIALDQWYCGIDTTGSLGTSSVHLSRAEGERVRIRSSKKRKTVKRSRVTWG